MILLARHGQSSTNALGLLVGRSDPELTDRGREQARLLRALTSEVEEVWTSPLQRAQETARLAAPAHVAHIHHSFIEVDYGELDGQPLASVTDDQWESFETDRHYVLGGGESLAQVDARVHAVLEDLLGDPTSLLHQLDRHLLIVSHVSPIKSALAWALGVGGQVAWRTRIDNGSLTTVGVRRTHPQLVACNVVPIAAATS